MALRNIIGTDHVPTGAAVDWRTFLISGLDWWSTNRSLSKATKNADGYMQVDAWRSGVDNILQITEGRDGLPATTKKIYVGFNYKVLVAAPNATLANMCLFLDSAIDPGASPGRAFTSLILANELPDYAANKEYHIDVCLNVDTGVVERWIDDLKLSDVVVPAGAVKTNLAARKFILATFLSSNGQTNSRYGARDIFINDDLDEGDGVTSRLGRQRIAPILIDTVEGEGWTTASASLKEGLTLPVDSSALGVISPAEPTDLVAKLSSLTLAQGESITGISFTTSMINTGTGAISAIAKLQTDDVVVNGFTNTDIRSTFLFGRRLGVFGKDAKGRAWTPARLAASKLLLRQS